MNRTEPLYTTALIDGTTPVTIFEEETALRALSEEGRLLCPSPSCGSPRLLYRHGPVVQPHFSHIGEVCGYRGESAEHFLTKKYLREAFERDNPGSCAGIEVCTDPKRPDILVELRDETPLFPKKVAVEVQRSPIGISEMDEKIISNTRNGIYTMYIFDAGSGNFLRRMPGRPKSRRRVCLAESFWDDLNSHSYYFLMEPGKSHVPRIFHVRLGCVGMRPLQKDIVGWDEVDDFRLRTYDGFPNSYKLAGLDRFEDD